MTANNDITTFAVQLQRPEHQPIDFGHAHLFLASKPGRNAETLVWQPILHWIKPRAHGVDDNFSAPNVRRRGKAVGAVARHLGMSPKRRQSGVCSYSH